jgi:hypothetical protein
MLAGGGRHAEESVMSEGTLSSEVTDRRPMIASGLLLGGLIVLALALRFWRLGDWNFQATEMFTLRDSLNPRFSNPRPLGYLLNYYLVLPFRPLDEFGLRLLPAIFGVLAVPAFYLVSRRLIGTRAALFGTLLVALSPLLVMYSQLARYWSLVFFFSAIYPYALYIGIRERSGRALALGAVTGVLAVLSHPVSVLLVGGPALLLVASLRREHLTRLWSQKTVRWTAVLLLLLVAAIALRLWPMLQGWISQHDKNPGSGQFLLRSPGGPGVKQMFLLLAFLEGPTLPVALAAAAGIYVLWQGRDRPLALFLASLALFPMAFIALISLRTPASTYYMLPAVPVFFIGAGVFLDRLFEVDWKLRPRWLLPATVAAIVIAAGVPTLISEYRNGRRYDFRSAARWMEQRLAPGDIVFSDQPMVLAHYLAGTEVQRLRYDTAPLTESVRLLKRSGTSGTLWIVAPAPGHAFRTALKQGGLIGWIYDHCQLSATTGRGRVDFRQQYLHVYRCPPAAPPSASADRQPVRPTGL